MRRLLLGLSRDFVTGTYDSKAFPSLDLNQLIQW